MGTGPGTRRRTQQERRDATMAKLLDGTIAALAEVGYARTTIKEICDRAGVSQGALFRYFDSRAALMAATAAEVGNRQFAAFAAAGAAEVDDPLAASIGFLQRHAR